MISTIKHLFALFMILTLAACSSGPEPKEDELDTPELRATMGPLQAFDEAGPWLPESTEGVVIASGPEGWRAFETWLFPLADASLEPGSPGTADGLSRDLTALVEQRLGFDIFALHTIVLGGSSAGATIVAFGDVELPENLPTSESPAGTVFELSMSRVLQGIEADPSGFGINPTIYILPVDMGLVFAMRPETFGETSFSDSSNRDQLRSRIASVDADRPGLVLTALSGELTDMPLSGEIPVPENFVMSLGNRVTLEMQGTQESLDEMERGIASYLEEKREAARAGYEMRAQAPTSEYFSQIYQYHLLEGLAAQATPQRSEGVLRYDVELSEQGWLTARIMAAAAGWFAFQTMQRRAGPQPYETDNIYDESLEEVAPQE